MLIIGSMKNPDPVASKEELEGFDFMDKASTAPVVKLIQHFQAAPAVREVVARVNRTNQTVSEQAATVQV
jgi:hypothetical protein